jgi:hypothetical protein
VRDVEVKLELDRNWQKISKPRVEMREPENQGLARDLPAIYDLIALALETDSTRVATLEIGGSFAVSDLGIRKGYHALSHHGQLEENLDLLVQIELYQMEQFARFLEKLASIRESATGKTLSELWTQDFSFGPAASGDGVNRYPIHDEWEQAHQTAASSTAGQAALFGAITSKCPAPGRIRTWTESPALRAATA